MTKIGFRLAAVVLCTALASLVTHAQSTHTGPIYEMNISGLDGAADVKNLVASIRNSPDVEYCRFANDRSTLIVQSKAIMTYEEIDALISETGYRLSGTVLTSKGVRMDSSGGDSQSKETKRL